MHSKLMSRGGLLGIVVVIGALAGLLISQNVGASSVSPELPQVVNAQDVPGDELPPPLLRRGWFAKYEGIDGESQDTNHDKWIDILSIDWGVHKPGGGATGQSRRRGAVVVEDLALTMEYEKSSPKLLEAVAKGKVIPKLEIETTATYGGARATYLRYELTNVMITSYQVSGSSSEGKPRVVVGTNFEEVKVTYTEYDHEGNSKGNVETEFKVEKDPER